MVKERKKECSINEKRRKQTKEGKRKIRKESNKEL